MALKPRFLVELFLLSSLLGVAYAFQVPPNSARRACTGGFSIVNPAAQSPSSVIRSPESSTQLNFFGRFFNKRAEKDEEKQEAISFPLTVTEPEDVITNAQPIPARSKIPVEEADIIIIGGGVSGLVAATAAAEASTKKGGGAAKKIIVVEAGDKFGGRVVSETTKDGYTLDQGFAVFIEEYPTAKKLLDYPALNLKPFLPGALVKIKSRSKLARVSDPLRIPADTFESIISPVGSLDDKIKVLPLIFNVRTKSIEELFEERETDTQTALTDRWGFSKDFINKFYKPFLEGIYLAPLSEQSSRMFSFVFKMFSEGSAMLPAGGMGSVSDQLVRKAQTAGVELRTNLPVSRVTQNSEDGSWMVECSTKKQRFHASSVIVATDGQVAQRLLSHVDGFESLETLPEQPQRSVGCLYYGFQGPAPVEDPILVLSGIGDESGNEANPVNNICFPSVVNTGYAPEGCNLCSVTILSNTMELYKGRPEALDLAVRQQLATWFPDEKTKILETWDLKKIFYVRWYH
jgi:phytoene dehydrogenase-like protein